MADLPPYLFAEIDRKKALKEAEGVDVISLGIGDPDMPTPQRIIDAMATAITDPANHQYPAYAGSRPYRAACAECIARCPQLAAPQAHLLLLLLRFKELFRVRHRILHDRTGLPCSEE